MSGQRVLDFVRSLPSAYEEHRRRLSGSDVFTTTGKTLERSSEGWRLIEHPGGRTLRMNSTVEITCFCVQHIDTSVCLYQQKLLNHVVFPCLHFRLSSVKIIWIISQVLDQHKVRYFGFRLWFHRPVESSPNTLMHSLCYCTRLLPVI